MPVPGPVYTAALNGDVAVLREYFASGDRDPTPLPRGVFKLVLSFWQSKRDWWWYRVPSARYGDSNYGSWD
tara:strand:- start:405 stop:617 length:213 start_codon:yes stop_codon:yes gene_type:complete